MADDDNIGGEVAENEEYSRTMKRAKVEGDESKKGDIEMADDDNIGGKVVEMKRIQGQQSGQRMRTMRAKTEILIWQMMTMLAAK